MYWTSAKGWFFKKIGYNISIGGGSCQATKLDLKGQCGSYLLR